MSKTSIFGIVTGLASLLIAYIWESEWQMGAITALLRPTAAIIVFGGTIGAVMLSFPGEDLKRVGKIIGVAMRNKTVNTEEIVQYFKMLSIKARKDGILKLQEDMSSACEVNPMIKRGIQMVIDGTSQESVKAALENDVYMVSERHKAGAAIFDAAGGFAPTMGIIGTVLGLVHVLGNLEDTSSLGGKIATAFIATLYGVGSANILWIPIANRLKAINKKEMIVNDLIIEGVIGIQDGISPNALEERLSGYLTEKKDSQAGITK
jgi:chemotaxis protein MotA